ncbi:MauE/DoxX family redox-associated membrane protein [Actinophytocola xanthii]|uniref:DoxX family protein n=1 Tax=Actinophytocola xanthii TaxID=1912961 RepID=A0A1Q8CKH9_9PSEU|nr:MauE/DoxX family redox-associated membrane protein [Actinophytocola xanthii]OLF14839.1 DoxX family protein [Actinophytocola xanthii]
MGRPGGRVLDGIGVLVRLGLAGVWLVSGGIKVADLNQAYVAVQAYDLLPAGLVSVVAAAVPFLELALGVLLLVGLGTRVVAAVSAVVLLAFVGAVAQAWARGLSIDCGCFGGGGQVAAGETAYPEEIARDIGFLLLCAWLVVRPRTPFSLDGWLTGNRQDVEDTVDTGDPQGRT